MCFGQVLGMCWNRFGHISDIVQTCVEHVLEMCWTCVGYVLDMFWTFLGHVLDICWTCFGHDWVMVGTEDVILSCNIVRHVFLKIIICYLVAKSQFWKKFGCFG